MNAFNRIVTIIILFILLALLLALAISPLDVVHWMQEHLANFSAWLARLQATDPTNFNIGRAGCCGCCIARVASLDSGGVYTRR